MWKILLSLWPITLLAGCALQPFGFERGDRTSMIQKSTGLYVHREVELRVDARRFKEPPEDAAAGAASSLVPMKHDPGGAASTYFVPVDDGQRNGFRTWKSVTSMWTYDLAGKGRLGVQVRWEKEGAVTAGDTMEFFQYPVPDESHLNVWSPWVEADHRREGVFAWHSEANGHANEPLPKPKYPFQIRHRLVLSKVMYP